MSKERKRKKRFREPVNGLTHLAGGLIASVGLIVLLARAASEGRADQLVAFGIFGFSLIALYSASALYHLLPLSPLGVARLRRVDHMSIFVLIAGTYTPFCLLALDGRWRAGLLGLVWVSGSEPRREAECSKPPLGSGSCRQSSVSWSCGRVDSSQCCWANRCWESRRQRWSDWLRRTVDRPKKGWWH